MRDFFFSANFHPTDFFLSLYFLCAPGATNFFFSLGALPELPAPPPGRADLLVVLVMLVETHAEASGEGERVAVLSPAFTSFSLPRRAAPIPASMHTRSVQVPALALWLFGLG